MKKLAITLTTFLVGGCLMLFGGCRHGQHNKESHINFVFDYLEEILDLDAAQQTKLEGIKKELMVEIEQLHAGKEKMHPLFKEQLASDKINTAVVKQAIGEHRAQMDKAIDLAVDRLAEFHATLTPVQKQKLIAKLEKMRKWHGCQ